MVLYIDNFLCQYDSFVSRFVHLLDTLITRFLVFYIPSFILIRRYKIPDSHIVVTITFLPIKLSPILVLEGFEPPSFIVSYIFKQFQPYSKLGVVLTKGPYACHYTSQIFNILCYQDSIPRSIVIRQRSICSFV